MEIIVKDNWPVSVETTAEARLEILEKIDAVEAKLRLRVKARSSKGGKYSAYLNLMDEKRS